MKKILCLVFAGFGAEASAGAQSLPLACTEVGTQLEYADYDSRGALTGYTQTVVVASESGPDGLIVETRTALLDADRRPVEPDKGGDALQTDRLVVSAEGNLSASGRLARYGFRRRLEGFGRMSGRQISHTCRPACRPAASRVGDDIAHPHRKRIQDSGVDTYCRSPGRGAGNDDRAGRDIRNGVSDRDGPCQMVGGRSCGADQNMVCTGHRQRPRRETEQKG